MKYPHYLIPDWPALPTVHACVTTRRGPGTGWENFNLALHVEDNVEQVQNHRVQLQRELSLPTQPHWLTQVHGDVVVELPTTEITADASYTQQAGEVCAVLTADCLPVLLCNADGTQVAAVHAGWRGLANEIIVKTLARFNEPKENILAWLGPAISQTHYEVGADLRSHFMQKHADFAVAFQQKAQSWYCDLYALARLQLQQHGVCKIYGGQHCTYTEKELFYSYRRDGAKTGRMASLIWLQTTPQ